jgi:hypothetical protein
VTTDRSISLQQNVASIPIALIVLFSPSNDADDLKRFVPELLSVLNHAQPRTVTEIQP